MSRIIKKEVSQEKMSNPNPFPVIVNDPGFSVKDLPPMCQIVICEHITSLLFFTQRLGRKKRFAYKCFLKDANGMPSFEIIGSDFCFSSEEEAGKHLTDLIHECNAYIGAETL